MERAPSNVAPQRPELQPAIIDTKQTGTMGSVAGVPFVDLVRLHGPLRGEFTAALERVVASGRYHLGPETQAFEAEFALHEGAERGVACGSGSDALYLALRALNIGDGDAVVTVSNSFLATAESIGRTGARVLFAEPDPTSRCMDPADLAKLLSEPGADRVKAVIPVHLYGHPADIVGIRRALADAGREDVAVIGDAAQCHGISGIGGLTNITCYSFYPAKNLGALGDGGIVLCRDEAVEKRLRSLRNHGRGSKHDSIEYGVNSRFDEIQAAVLRIKLRRLREWNAHRREIASRYRRALSGLSRLTLPADHPDHVYHLFVVEADDRDAVVTALKERGVGVGMHYPVPVHHMTPYPSDRPLPVTERQCARNFSLPMFPGMRSDEVDAVCNVVADVLA